MKNMYAIKCLYQINIYNENEDKPINSISRWEERIILIKASSMDDADSKSEKYAKDYEMEYYNVENQIVKLRLYAILDIFATFDTTSRNNIEVYANHFDATVEEVEKMLDVEYPFD